MPKSAKRRFVGLTTEEVSLVDAPANQVEFLVKKQEAEGMGANAASAAVNKEPVNVQTDVGNAEVAKALEHVNGIVAKITQIVTRKDADPNDEDDDEDSDESNAEETVEAADVEKAARSELKSILMAAGLEGDALKGAMKKCKAAGVAEKLAKAFPPPKGGKGKADDDEDGKGGKKNPFPKKKVKKAAEVDDSDDSDDDGEETEESLTMTSLASAVQKAAAFTPARVEALTRAYETLKLVLESVSPGTTPKTKVPALSTHSNQTGISELTQKSLGGVDIADVLKSVGDSLSSISTRLEKIETARGESNSAEDEGTTDTKKAASGMWSGVL